MAQAFDHRPVMLQEVVDLLGPVPPGTLIDATVGGGGHARAVLEALPHLRVLGVDRDMDALDAARANLAEFGTRVELRHGRFDQLAGFAPGPVSGVLFDLGVSSPQFDRMERGFSYRGEGPLDMRMDTTQDLTAADVVNHYTVDDLARLFAAAGETRFAGRIARAIVAARPLHTTIDLVDAVKAGIPAAARRTGGHPARRAFQAIRVEVNDELDLLRPALEAALELLAPGGRCVVLSYHSGEDRLVKETFLDASTGGCTCPPRLPCVCGATPEVRLLTRGARQPSTAEVAANPRAESARLRAVERLDEDDAA